jgi:hypothetical protein
MYQIGIPRAKDRTLNITDERYDRPKILDMTKADWDNYIPFTFTRITYMIYIRQSIKLAAKKRRFKRHCQEYLAECDSKFGNLFWYRFFRKVLDVVRYVGSVERLIIEKTYSIVLNFLAGIYRLLNILIISPIRYIVETFLVFFYEFTYPIRELIEQVYDYLYPYLQINAFIYKYTKSISNKILGFFLEEQEILAFYDIVYYGTIYIKHNVFTTMYSSIFASIFGLCIGVLAVYLEEGDLAYETFGETRLVYYRFNKICSIFTKHVDWEVNFFSTTFFIIISWIFTINPYFGWYNTWQYHWYYSVGLGIYEWIAGVFKIKYRFTKFRTYDMTVDTLFQKQRRWLHAPTSDLYLHFKVLSFRKVRKFAEKLRLYNTYVEQYENRALAWRSYHGPGYLFLNPGKSDAMVGDVRYYPYWTPFSTLMYRPREFSPHYMGGDPDSRLNCWVWLPSKSLVLPYNHAGVKKAYRACPLDLYMYFNWVWYDFWMEYRGWIGGNPGHYNEVFRNKNRTNLRIQIETEVNDHWYYKFVGREIYYELPFTLWQDTFRMSDVWGHYPTALYGIDFNAKDVIHRNRYATMYGPLGTRLKLFDILRQ